MSNKEIIKPLTHYNDNWCIFYIYIYHYQYHHDDQADLITQLIMGTLPHSVGSNKPKFTLVKDSYV